MMLAQWRKDPNESEYPRKYKVKEGVSFEVKQTKTQKLQNMSKTDGPEGKIAKKKLEQRKDKEAKLPKLKILCKSYRGCFFFKKKERRKKT